MRISALFLIILILLTQKFTSNAEVYRVNKNIAKIVEKLKPGDTLLLEKGHYFETIKIPCDDVTIASAEPGVLLDGAEDFYATDFEPTDRAGVFFARFPAFAATSGIHGHRIIPWVWYNGEMLLAKRQSLNSDDTYTFYIKNNPKGIELNINGKNIPRNAKITIPLRAELIDVGRSKNVKIRGINFTRSGFFAINAQFADATSVKNCHVYWCGGGILTGTNSHVAENIIRFTNASATRNSHNSLLEDNVVVASRIQWDDIQRWAGTMKTNTVSNSIWQRNWIMDEYGGGLVKAGNRAKVRQWKFTCGLWPDINCYDNYYFNNSIARLGHAGIYIEYTSDRNVISTNAIQDCAMGITLRQASKNTVTRNWIFTSDVIGRGKVDTEGYCSWGKGYDDKGKPLKKLENHPMWGHQLLEGICIWHSGNHDGYFPTSRNAIFQNLIQLSGRAISVPQTRFDYVDEKKENDKNLSVVQEELPANAKATKRQKKWQAQTWFTEEELNKLPLAPALTNIIDQNYITRKEGDNNFAYLGNEQVKDIEIFRQKTNWGKNSKVGNFSPKALGLEAIWTLTWASLKPDKPVAILHDPQLETQSAKDFNFPMFWNGSDVKAYYTNTRPKTGWYAPIGQTQKGVGGSKCLYIFPANKAKNESDKEVGWSSAPIPVKQGVKFRLELQVKGEKLEPFAETKNVSVVSAFFLYKDKNGFPLKQDYFINANKNKHVGSGDFGFTKVKADTTVPKDASWLVIKLTANPSKTEGTVWFDNIHIDML